MISYTSLNADEQYAVVCALRVAAEVYEKDAKTVATVEGHQRMAEQFEKQTVEAKRLADQIEDADSIRLMPSKG